MAPHEDHYSVDKSRWVGIRSPLSQSEHDQRDAGPETVGAAAMLIQTPVKAWREGVRCRPRCIHGRHRQHKRGDPEKNNVESLGPFQARRSGGMGSAISVRGFHGRRSGARRSPRWQRVQMVCSHGSVGVARGGGSDIRNFF